MFIAFLIEVVASIAAFFAKVFLGRWLKPKDPGQAAVDAQQKMDQQVIDRPTKAQAVKDLESGKI